jgi:hypothetical protein
MRPYEEDEAVQGEEAPPRRGSSTRIAIDERSEERRGSTRAREKDRSRR